MSNIEKNNNDPQRGLALKERTKTKRPQLYKVVMLNDDYTPMEFVVTILQKIFNKNNQDAFEIMMHVHTKGIGICGVYTYEIAETKLNAALTAAQQNQHPLQLVIEPASSPSE